MKYEAVSFQDSLNRLFIGEALQNVHYYSEYDGYVTFNRNTADVQEVPVSPILFETESGKYITLMSANYEPYPGYTTGIGFSDRINEPFERAQPYPRFKLDIIKRRKNKTSVDN